MKVVIPAGGLGTRISEETHLLKTHPEFEIDKTIQNKLLITVAPDGYLTLLPILLDKAG